jgi:hypothetical protein
MLGEQADGVRELGLGGVHAADEDVETRFTHSTSDRRSPSASAASSVETRSSPVVTPGGSSASA